MLAYWFSSRKIVVAKIKFAHAYMINMLYLNTAKYHESVGCIRTSAAGTRARARARARAKARARARARARAS